MENDFIRPMLLEFLSSQRSAVLATTENGRPFLSLMAFAATPDLKHLLVATYRATRKYRNLTADDRVALLVDNRANLPSDTTQTIAVTVMGRAAEATAEEKEPWHQIYLAKHPHLEDFVNSPACALVRVRVEKFLVVRNFQETSELTP
jgi:heme iron utilization protein